MSWLQLIVGLVQLLRELVKYIEAQENNKKKKVEHVKRFKQGLKKARETGDTSGLEQSFSFPMSDTKDDLEPNTLDREPDEAGDMEGSD